MSELLACPDCGEQTFSWAIEQVQFGNVHEHDNGDRHSEAVDTGPILGDDLEDKGPYCTTCDKHKELDDLVVVNNDE